METTVSNPNTQLPHNQRTTDKGTLATAHRFDGPWLEDVDTLTLGRGVRVKILFQDDTHTDMLVKFPPGYVEPEHTHQASHSVLIVEGLQILHGEQMRPGDSFGPRAWSPTAPSNTPKAASCSPAGGADPPTTATRDHPPETCKPTLCSSIRKRATSTPKERGREMELADATEALSSLEGRTVLVTGAGGGMGRATSLRAAAAGAYVVATDVEGQDKTALLIHERGGQAEAHTLDVTDPHAWESVTKTIMERRGGLDGLANIAGMVDRVDSLLDQTVAGWGPGDRSRPQGHVAGNAGRPAAHDRGWRRKHR